MKAIVVTDQSAGTAGMKLVERREPKAAINDVVVQVHASGFVPTELTWSSTWVDRVGRNRTWDRRLRPNIGTVVSLDDPVVAFNSNLRWTGKTVVRVRPDHPAT
jgi:hypothetical protein